VKWPQAGCQKAFRGQSMTLDEQKKEFAIQVGKDRLVTRIVLVPQLVLVLAVAILLAVVAGYGLFAAIQVFRERAEADLLVKGASVFVGGTSSVLGFLVVRLFGKLGELSRDFIGGEQRYSSFAAQAQAADSVAAYIAVIRAYQGVSALAPPAVEKPADNRAENTP